MCCHTSNSLTLTQPIKQSRLFKNKGVGWGGAKDKLLSFHLYGLLLCFSLLPKHRRSSHRYKSLYGETFLKQQLSKSHLIDFFKILYLSVFKISHHVVTTVACTWEAVHAEALVNTMVTVAMTTMVSGKSYRSTLLTVSAAISCRSKQSVRFQCNGFLKMTHDIVTLCLKRQFSLAFSGIYCMHLDCFGCSVLEICLSCFEYNETPLSC